MKLTAISKLKFKRKSTIQGFVVSIRNKTNIAFLVVKDFSSKIQITINKTITPQFNELIDRLTIQSVITVVGQMHENPQVKLNGREFIPSKIILETKAATPLPVDDNSLLDQRLDYRWIDLRSERNQLIFKVQTVLTNYFREFLLKHGFVEIHTPKLIATASESGSDLFEISNYFDKKAYLAQSPQFYKQMAIAAGFEKVFECGPVFRAEKSRSNRHGTEFVGFDLEFYNVESVIDVMRFEEAMIRYAFKKLQKKYGADIKRVFAIELKLPVGKFPIMNLKDIYQELKQRYNYYVPEVEQTDLNAEGEKLANQLAIEKFNSEFLFVVGYDKATRPFYHARDAQGNPQGYDLIYRGVEITSGAKREHRYDQLVKQAQEKGLDKDVRFYLDFFKYGIAPHGGFGIGLDRITMLILGITIKEAMLCFRGPDRLVP